MKRLKYVFAGLIFSLLVTGVFIASSPVRAQANAESGNLATFVALTQYIRSQPTPTDVNAARIPVLAQFDGLFVDIYVEGFIAPFTGETAAEAKARIDSVPTDDRYAAAMVESYRLAPDPFLLDIIHILLAQHYVGYFTAGDLAGANEFLGKAEIQRLADAFDYTDYTVSAPSAAPGANRPPPSTRTAADVESANLATFVALTQYIRSQPTPTDVNAARIPVLAQFDGLFVDIYVEGFIAPFTGETAAEARARIESVPTDDRYAAAMVESYRLASDPFLLDIIHILLAQHYVGYFTAGDLAGANEFLGKSEIQSLADGFDAGDYAIPAPSATTPPTDAGSPETDRAALVALYNATDGANWSDSENWLSDMPVGEWRGVTADEDGRVTELSLGDIGLSGTIPPELGSLTNLTDLWLDNNQLSGAIPPELGNLSSLIRLSLYSNELSGPIPPELGNLSSLEQLFLNDNELSGKLPQEMTKLSALQQLTFYRNSTLCAPVDGAFQTWLLGIAQMAGSSCAPEDSPADRAALVGLHGDTDGANWADDTNWLSNRPLREWYGVTTDADGRVIGLYLRDNQLSGQVPSELGNLTNLTELFLHNNELSGAIPPELGNLTNLRFLFLRSNELSGAIPPELGDLSSLIWLSLDSNELSGPIPPELGNLTNLRNLYLNHNVLSGALPQELTKLTNLQTFYFDGNPELCAPEDGAVRIWLQGLSNWRGNGCGVVEDRAALVALYNATGGDNWSTSANWLSDRPMGGVVRRGDRRRRTRDESVARRQRFERFSPFRAGQACRPRNSELLGQRIERRDSILTGRPDQPAKSVPLWRRVERRDTTGTGQTGGSAHT